MRGAKAPVGRRGGENMLREGTVDNGRAKKKRTSRVNALEPAACICHFSLMYH